MDNYDFLRALGDVVKRACGKDNLTQTQVALKAGVDVRTVLNIENYRGNPKMESVSALIRTLKLEPREIYYPELEQEGPLARKLGLLLAGCSEQEAEVLFPIVEAVLDALRSKEKVSV